MFSTLFGFVIDPSIECLRLCLVRGATLPLASRTATVRIESGIEARFNYLGLRGESWVELLRELRVVIAIVVSIGTGRN